jgi:hypothetical protein
MSRIPRTLVVVALSFALLAVAVPAAHARTLAKPLSSNPAIGSWLDATLAWVGSLVTGTPPEKVPHGSKLTYTSGSGTGTGSGYAQPMTCSTIDPNGSPRCGGV